MYFLQDTVVGVAGFEPVEFSLHRGLGTQVRLYQYCSHKFLGLLVKWFKFK